MNPQEQHEYDVATQKGHTIFCGSIPVYYPQTIELLDAVRKKNPDLVVVKGSRSIGKYIDNELVNFYRSLDLAYANLPNQVVGSLGYDGESYIVQSRLIQNARFSSWNSEEHRSKKSKHMKNIVKEALNVLLPTQFKEVLEESVSVIERSIHSIREKSRDGLNSKLRHLGYAVLRKELLNMAKVGYVPENCDMADAMKYVVETQEEYERNANYNPDKMFVWIKPDCVMYGDGKTLEQFKSIEELPEDIQGKLFVLMVGDDKRYIDEVGMKFTDNKFWVLV